MATVLVCVEGPCALTVGIENVFRLIMYGHSLGSHKEFEHVIVINKKTVVWVIEASEGSFFCRNRYLGTFTLVPNAMITLNMLLSTFNL